MRFKLGGRPQPREVLWMLVQASRWCLSYYFYLQTEDIYALLLAASVQWQRFEPTKWIRGDFYPLFLCFEMSLDSVSHQLHKYLSMNSGLRCTVKRMYNLNPLLVHTVLALGLIYSLGVKREKKSGDPWRDPYSILLVAVDCECAVHRPNTASRLANPQDLGLEIFYVRHQNQHSNF